MNDLTRRLEQLNRAVPDAPGFTANVMQRIAQEPAMAPPDLRRRRARGGAHWFIGAALAACAISGAAAGVWALAPEPVALAQVTEAMQRARTLSFTEVSEERHGSFSERVVCKAGVGSRTEAANGVAYVYDERCGDLLAIDKSVRRAVKSHPGRNDGDLATWLLNLPADRGANVVGRRDINGRRTDGVRLATKLPQRNVDAEVTLWVDPESHLPVEAEIVPLDARGGDGVPRKMVLRDIRFDEPLDDALFDVEKSIPPGFRRTILKPSTRPAPASAEEVMTRKAA